MTVKELIDQAKEKYPGYKDYSCYSRFVLASNKPDMTIEKDGWTTLKDPSALIIFHND
jgi:hypothetical protein